MQTQPTFEKAITRLEEITKALEQGTEPLEMSIQLYEEGVKLAAICSDQLKDAEKKIVSLSELSEGGQTGEK